MALNANELFSSAAGTDSTRTIAHRVAPKQFAAGSGTLAVNAPVAYNTSTELWAPWTNAGANGEDLLKGLVFPDPIVLNAADEVLGHVLMEGIAHLADVQAATSESDANVLAELQTQARLLGIHIQGAEGVR